MLGNSGDTMVIPGTQYIFLGVALRIKYCVPRILSPEFRGLLKIVVVQKPAVAARLGINPFTQQQQMFKAKPARKVIKVRPLKALKDMVK